MLRVVGVVAASSASWGCAQLWAAGRRAMRRDEASVRDSREGCVRRSLPGGRACIGELEHPGPRRRCRDRMPTTERAGQRRLGGVLAECVALYLPRETHSGVAGSPPRLDRLYCLAPGHALLQMRTKVAARVAPAEWAPYGVSDRAPLKVRLGQRSSMQAAKLVPLGACCEEV